MHVIFKGSINTPPKLVYPTDHVAYSNFSVKMDSAKKRKVDKKNGDEEAKKMKLQVVAENKGEEAKVLKPEEGEKVNFKPHLRSTIFSRLLENQHKRLKGKTNRRKSLNRTRILTKQRALM